MKISTKGRLATVTVLGAIALIALIVALAYAEVETAERQRQHTAEVGRALNNLQLVTFEFLLHRQPRARMQAQAVSERLRHLLDAAPAANPQQLAVMAELRRRAATTRRIFAELVDTASGAAESDPATMQRYEGQLTTRLLLLHQESLADAFRLGDLTAQRIHAAQRRVVAAILGGLTLIALVALGAAWLIHRDVLAPISRLERATREIAAGNWNHKLEITSHDEIGETTRNFDAMVQTLRNSFVQIERNNHELAALNKEIEAFSYSVSHDLRGPLRSMDGFSLALLEDYGDKLDDDAKDSLQRIRAASQRMGRLIDELLGLSRVTRVELSLKSVDVSAIAREIAESLRQQEPARHIRWEIEDGIVVKADKALMQIAMQNLIENAWKFTGKTAEPVIRVGCRQEQGRPVCFVADNGVGFDMAYADRLFGAFQRLHHETEFSGTGIGLAIVHRIFRRHEGRIWVDAKPGQGATFFFTVKDTRHDGRQQDDTAG